MLLPTAPFEKSFASYGVSELFQPRSASDDETVDSFFRRRLGREVPALLCYCLPQSSLGQPVKLLWSQILGFVGRHFHKCMRQHLANLNCVTRDVQVIKTKT